MGVCTRTYLAGSTTADPCGRPYRRADLIRADPGAYRSPHVDPAADSTTNGQCRLPMSILPPSPVRQGRIREGRAAGPIREGAAVGTGGRRNAARARRRVTRPRTERPFVLVPCAQPHQAPWTRHATVVEKQATTADDRPLSVDEHETGQTTTSSGRSPAGTTTSCVFTLDDRIPSAYRSWGRTLDRGAPTAPPSAMPADPVAAPRSPRNPARHGDRGSYRETGT